MRKEEVGNLTTGQAFLYRKKIYRLTSMLGDVERIIPADGRKSSFDLRTEVRPCSEEYVGDCLKTVAMFARTANNGMESDLKPAASNL